MKLFLPVVLSLLTAPVARAEPIVLMPQTITEWKAVYGVVETRDRVPARARIGGTITELTVSEGDEVTAGQRIALIKDQKLDFQLAAMDAQISSLNARLKTADEDLVRGEELITRGTITKQRLSQLQAQVDVLKGEISALQSQQQVIEQSVSEGEVLSPEDGVVLSVPTSKGSVINPGEAIAVIGGGGVFLRLAIPERHSDSLQQGSEISIGEGESGLLVKIYPQIENGRVLADVEVADLDGRFIGRRVPVRLPVGNRQALLVPQDMVTLRGGIDFVTVKTAQGPLQRSVVRGAGITRDGVEMVEILSGLSAGDTVVAAND